MLQRLVPFFRDCGFCRFAARLGLGMAAAGTRAAVIHGQRVICCFQFAIESLEESHEEIRDELLPVFRLQELILEAQMPANDYLILGEIGNGTKFELLSNEINAGFEQTGFRTLRYA